jgi:type IV pilus assembly protein PilV
MQTNALRSAKLKPRRQFQGATLIEVLVAVLVLSLGLLGMAAMQVRAIKGNHSAMQRTQAVMMSYYILDAMRVDRDNMKAGTYNTGSYVAPGEVITDECDAAAYTGANLPDNNRKHWLTALKASIGEASDTTTCGAIYCDASGACRIQVKWDDSRAGGLGAQLIETGSRL